MTLPQGWAEVTLEECCELITTGRRPKGGVRHIHEGILSLGGEHVGADGRVDLSRPRYIPESFAAGIESARVIPQDILIVKDGATTGKVAIADDRFAQVPGYPNEHVFLCRTPTEISAAYLFAILRSEEGKAAILNDFRGAAQGGISRGFASGVPVALPPLAEQCRIVAKLDALTARLARARAELDQVMKSSFRVRQAVLTAALSGQGEAQQETTANQFSSFIVRGAAHWTLKRLDEVCRIEGGSQPPKSTFTYEPGPGKVRLIQIRDYKTDKYLTYIDRALARRFCTADEVMIGRYGPPIFQILRGIEGAYNVALMKAVPLECVTNEYLYYLLQLPVLRQYVEQDSDRTAGQDGVNKAHLLQFRCFIPPIEEQNVIVERIKSGLARADRLEAEATRARALLDRLESALLAKAFRGELVSQDPNDEPAQTLLDRIRTERAAAPKAKRGRKAKVAGIGE